MLFNPAFFDKGGFFVFKNKNVQITNEVTTGEPLEKGGYFVAYNLVIRNAMKVFDLNSGQYSCLIMLFSYAGADKDKCFPSQEALAKDLNIKDSRSVRRYLEQLESKGVITIYNRQNKNDLKITNLYDLSPCLAKIRELYCSEQDQSQDFGIKLKRKTSNDGQDNSVLSKNTEFRSSETSEEKSEFGECDNDRQDNSVLSIESDRTELSEQIGQNCPTTNNTIQLTNKNINNISIDDDKRASDSPLSIEKINNIINLLREASKGDITDRSFKSVVSKVLDKYHQGKVNNLRDYLATSLANKIEQLELRRIKENAKSAIKSSKPRSSEQIHKEYMQHVDQLESDVSTSKKIVFYNWLEE